MQDLDDGIDLREIYPEELGFYGVVRRYVVSPQGRFLVASVVGTNAKEPARNRVS